MKWITRAVREVVATPQVHNYGGGQGSITWPGVDPPCKLPHCLIYADE